ncbi:MAG: hypothetical protein O6951_02620 [Actinobacteria bacterium]|nr:hypothetical protein [Actinomycetota bacterium]
MILAAFFFSMSSDRFHSWMLNHKCSAGLTKRMKWVALIAITLSLGFSAFFADRQSGRPSHSAAGWRLCRLVRLQPTHQGKGRILISRR